MDPEERVVVGTVTVKQEVTEELIDSILSAVFDWSPGWIERVRAKPPIPAEANYMSEVVAKGGTLSLVEWDEEENGHRRHEITIDKLLRGLELYSVIPGGSTPAQLEEDPPDAIMADCILQLALFGEVIYG